MGDYLLEPPLAPQITKACNTKNPFPSPTTAPFFITFSAFVSSPFLIKSHQSLFTRWPSNKLLMHSLLISVRSKWFQVWKVTQVPFGQVTGRFWKSRAVRESKMWIKCIITHSKDHCQREFHTCSIASQCQQLYFQCWLPSKVPGSVYITSDSVALSITYNTAQKSRLNPQFFLFCFQGGRTSCNILKWFCETVIKVFWGSFKVSLWAFSAFTSHS